MYAEYESAKCVSGELMLTSSGLVACWWLVRAPFKLEIQHGGHGCSGRYHRVHGLGRQCEPRVPSPHATGELAQEQARPRQNTKSGHSPTDSTLHDSGHVKLSSTKRSRHDLEVRLDVARREMEKSVEGLDQFTQEGRQAPTVHILEP
jgi:hypothetical protein